MTTAFAPAFWAFFTLTMKTQTPRSIRAILLLTAAAFCALNALHPGPSGDVSTTGISSPVTPGEPNGGPNSAAPTRYVPATFAGMPILISGLPDSTKGASDAVTPPFQTTLRALIADATRSALVI